MGIFASNVDMQTQEEAFQPDIPKQEYMTQVEERFGGSEEIVQIAFTSEEGDVFTVEVLKDIQEMEERVLEDEAVNRTLAETNQVSSGLMTLRGVLLSADQSLEVNDFIIQQAEKTEEGLNVAENQTQMYEYMNISLSLDLYLSRTYMEHNSTGAGLGSIEVLFSMSDIVSDPSSWEAVQEHQDEFEELLENLNPDSEMNHTEVSSFIDDWLDDMEGKNGPYLEYFLNLIKGTQSMLDADPPEGMDYDEEKDMTRAMALSFFGIAEPLGHLAEIDVDGMDEDPPSLELDFEEEKEKLANMTDADIKDTVSDVMDYDSAELNNSVDKGSDNLEEMIEESERSSEKLNNMEQLLNTTIEGFEEEEQEELAEQLREGYLRAVHENQTIVNDSKERYIESKEMIELSRQLAPLLEQMSEMIQNMVSQDFSPHENPESISAEIGLGMAFMDPELENSVRLEAQEKIIEIGEEISEDSTIGVRVSANQVMLEEINESADRSLSRLLPIAFIMVIIILFIVFRSFLETFLSLSVLTIAIIWTFGFGVILGYRFNPMIVAVPILLTGLIIDYGIQVVMRYREERNKEYKPKKSHIIAISTVGGALVLTSFTTSIGFLSKTLSRVEAMQQFGILAAVGITSSLFLMTAFLPSVIRIFEKRREEKKSEKSKRFVKKTKKHGKDTVTGMLSTSAKAADKHPTIVLIVVCIITISSIYGVVNIDAAFNIEDFLPEDQPQSENMDYIRANFQVTTNYAYVMTEGGDLATSEYLYALERTSEEITDSEIVGGYGEEVESPLTVLREYGTAPPGSRNYNSTIVQTFAESDTTGDEIPNENVAELYELLYDFDESRQSIERVLKKEDDGEYSSSVIRASVDQERIIEDLDNAAVLEDDLKGASEPLEEEGFTVKITSNPMINQEMTSELMDTQTRSLMFTVLIVAVTLSIIFYFLHKTVFLGILTTIPVAMIMLWIIATMYFLDVPFNVMTVSVTALTVGMGVDYSILVTHRFMEEISKKDPHPAMVETVQKKGAALFGSAGTTIAAFAILATSEILLLSQFGYITALALLYSFIVAVFVLPSALMVWVKYSKYQEKSLTKACPGCGDELTWVEEYDDWYCYECEEYKEELEEEEEVVEEEAKECPDCGDELTYVEEYDDWYCYECEEYKEELEEEVVEEVVEEPKICPDCGDGLTFVEEYESWYCTRCEEYKEEEAEVEEEEEELFGYECPNCGAEIEEEDKLCDHCGVIFEEEIERKACPDCGDGLTFVEEYESWYCYECEEYKKEEEEEEDIDEYSFEGIIRTEVVEETESKEESKEKKEEEEEEKEVEAKECPDCGDELTYVEDHDSWYCYSCKRYKEI